MTYEQTLKQLHTTVSFEQHPPDGIDMTTIELPTNLLCAITKAMTLAGVYAACMGMDVALANPDGSPFDADNMAEFMKEMWDSRKDAESDLTATVILTAALSQAGAKADGEKMSREVMAELDALPVYEKGGE